MRAPSDYFVDKKGFQGEVLPLFVPFQQDKTLAIFSQGVFFFRFSLVLTLTFVAKMAGSSFLGGGAGACNTITRSSF